MRITSITRTGARKPPSPCVLMVRGVEIDLVGPVIPGESPASADAVVGLDDVGMWVYASSWIANLITMSSLGLN